MIPGGQGFDNIWIKKEGNTIVDVIIGESKPLKGGAISMNKRNIRQDLSVLEVQMTDDWIKNVIERMMDNTNPITKKLGEDIQGFLNRGGDISKIASAFDNSTKELIIVNLGKTAIE